MIIRDYKGNCVACAVVPHNLASWHALSKRSISN